MAETRLFEHDGDRDVPADSSALVGAELRAARERLGWTLPAVSATLRIRLPYLEAIEAGRNSVLPGNAYAVGFIRTYAQTLGLDPDEIARRFKTEAAEVNRKTELAFPAPVPDRGIPAGAVVLVGAVIAVIAYAGWYRFSAIESGTTAVVQPVPARLAHLAEKPAEPSIPPASGPDGARVVAATPSPDPEATKPVVAAPPVPSPTPLPSKEAMGPPVPPVIAKQFAASAATPQLAAAANLGAPPAAPTLAPQVLAPPPSAGSGDGPRLQVKAISESWVQVREKQGGVLLNRVLRSGETWPVPSDKGPLLMTTGNAGGTALIVDGAAQAPLGPDGAVRRDIPLDLASLGDPKAGAAPLTDPAGPPPRPGPVSRTN